MAEGEKLLGYERLDCRCLRAKYRVIETGETREYREKDPECTNESHQGNTLLKVNFYDPDIRGNKRARRVTDKHE